jgi:gliding motility-associated lipoprotein GldD
MCVFKKFFYPISVCILLLYGITACQDNYSPKPNGYLRIDLPEKSYLLLTQKLPYSFEYPQYGIVSIDSDKNAEPYWINIEFPQYKGKIHLSYKKINGNLPELTEDARKLAYKHAIKADAINEYIIEHSKQKVYGILYEIKGNTASSVQFFVTDSSRNFLRGALYFSAQPNKDSLAPVINFFRKDIDHLIETFNWK